MATDEPSSTTVPPADTLPPRPPSSDSNVPPTHQPRSRAYLASGTVHLRTQTFGGSNTLQAAGISVIATANMLFRMSKELQDKATDMVLSAQHLMDDATRMGSDMMDVPVEPSRDNENANLDE